jgi:hypothetical protein
MQTDWLRKVRGLLDNLEDGTQCKCYPALRGKWLLRQPLGFLRAFIRIEEEDLVCRGGDEAEMALESYWQCPAEYPYKEQGWEVWADLCTLLYWLERAEVCRRHKRLERGRG